MLVGYLDAVTSSGYIEGWAYDDGEPFRPLAVAVLTDTNEVARGIANRYRWDLSRIGYGSGWCAFRLRLSSAATAIRRQHLRLCKLPELHEICQTDAIGFVEDGDVNLTNPEEIISSDPTLVHSIEQLSGCDGLFEDFIGANGVDAFVRAAYVYVLGRPVDDSGLESYRAHINDGSISPYELLRILSESDEFRAMPRPLIAPPEAGFAFELP